MKEKTDNIVDGIGTVLGAVRQVFVHAAITVGLFVAAAPPAIIFGSAFTNALRSSTSVSGGAANLAGWTLAVALESIGVISAHVALVQYRDWKTAGDSSAEGGFWTAALIVAAYSIVGISGIIIFDGDSQIRIGGVMAYLVAPMIYVSSALMSNAQYREKLEREQERKKLEESLGEKTAEQDERDWERERQDRLDEQDFQLKLKQKEINEKVRLAQAGVVDSPQKGPPQKQQRRQGLNKKEKIFLRHLQENPGALRNKLQLSEEVNISRPTIDKYIAKLEGSHFKQVNGLVIKISLDGDLSNEQT